MKDFLKQPLIWAGIALIVILLGVGIGILAGNDNLKVVKNLDKAVANGDARSAASYFLQDEQADRITYFEDLLSEATEAGNTVHIYQQNLDQQGDSVTVTLMITEEQDGTVVKVREEQFKVVRYNSRRYLSANLTGSKEES